MYRAYKYRLLPTEEQKSKLQVYFGCCRFIYNLGLETKIAAWESQRVSLSAYDLMKQTTELKRTECKWLSECSRESLESCLSNLDRAYKSFFKGAGFPKFKKRSSRQSIQFRQEGKVNEGKFYIPKIGWAEFIRHRPLGVGKIKTCTVSKVPSGKYFVSILVDSGERLPVKKPIAPETAVGVDVGLKTFAVLSDGTIFPGHKFLQNAQKRLRIEQRRLQRRFKRGVKISDQSNGWHQQKLVVALLHEKIVNQRADFLHKTSTSITKKYDTICLENLNVSGMIRNKNLSIAISNAGWATFAKIIKYKANWYGKNIIQIGKFEPSSKACSQCGYIFSRLSLSNRVWTCQNCGATHDRDFNAAKNIKKFGLEAKPSIANVSQ